MSELKKTVRRDLSLWSVRAWQRGYHEEFPKIFGWKYPILFHYDGTRVTFYHRLADFRHFKDVITKRVIEDDELFDRLNHSFLKYLEVLHTHMIAPTIDNLPELETVVGRIMSFYLFVVSDAFVAARPEAWEARRRSEGVLYTLDEQVEAILTMALSRSGFPPDFAHVIQSDEVSRGELTLIPELAKRRQSYILDDNGLIVGLSFVNYCQQHGLQLPIEETSDQSSGTLSGQSAFPGFAKGYVRLVNIKADLSKVKSGDILVSTMTSASYLPAIQRSAAVVTDEGGVTCHAAIACREVQKPCIVGTKVATKVLHDGDMVEVDATNGIVRKL